MKRLIASIASIALLCSLSIFPVAATKDTGIYADVKGHWGQAAMETWSERGVLRGSGGFCRPDDAITRGELAVLLQRVVGYQNASGHSFSDLTDTWYTEAICALSAAGVMKGNAGLVRPTDTVSRQEAAVLFARAFQLADGTTPLSYSDADEIAPWALGAVSALTQAGYMQGDQGKFEAESPIIRAAVITVLDKMFAAYYSAPGVYTGDVSGNVLVNAGGVVLKNGTITGNLIIADGVGNGDVSLDHVKVTGTVILRGCGENSFHILPGTDLSGSTIIVCKTASGGVRLVNESGTPIPMVNVADGMEGVTLTGSFENVVIASDVAVALKDANVTKAVSVTAENANVAVTGKSTVKQMDIAETASGTKLKVEGKGVTTLTVAGNGLTVDGKVQHLDVAPDVTQKPETPTGKPVTPPAPPDNSHSGPVITVLSTATANLASPQAGKTATDAVPAGAGFTVTTSWEPALVEGKFAKATVYVATLRFTPTYSYQWPAAAPTVAVNNSTAYGVNATLGTPTLEGNVVTVTATYGATATNLTIQAQTQNLPQSPAEGAITGNEKISVVPTVLADGVSAPNYVVSYQWYTATDALGAGPLLIQNATESLFSLPQDLTAGAHYYFCRMNADACSETDSAVITVTVLSQGEGVIPTPSNLRFEMYDCPVLAWDKPAEGANLAKYEFELYAGENIVATFRGDAYYGYSSDYCYTNGLVGEFFKSESLPVTITKIVVTPYNIENATGIAATINCNFTITRSETQATGVPVYTSAELHPFKVSGLPANSYCEFKTYNSEGGPTGVGCSSGAGGDGILQLYYKTDELIAACTAPGATIGIQYATFDGAVAEGVLTGTFTITATPARENYILIQIA